VISMDIRLPGMNGFEATKQIMRDRPTPIVVVSASVEREDLRVTMNALRAGALTVLEKPSGATSSEYEALAERLCTQLAIMSQVKVIRRRGAVKGLGPAQDGSSRNSGLANLGPRVRPLAVSGESGEQVLGIVASTGGPSALAQVLSGLGADFPLPVLVVQHIAASFLDGFASWLESVCPFSVEIVRDRAALQKGKVYMAAPDRHLCAFKAFVQADAGPPVSAQRPSGTVLFQSMARVHGSQAIGVLLTGMGEDGAEGLLRLRECGGYTIAEHESTAVVYGMPAEAVRLGAACESLPLSSIAGRVLEWLRISRHEFAKERDASVIQLEGAT
jgi:two-component system, chemotaxis family, protein-glutamate methylesterase/glutaminase